MIPQQMTVVVKILVEKVLVETEDSTLWQFEGLLSTGVLNFYALWRLLILKKRKRKLDLESGLGLKFCYCDELLQIFSLDFSDLEITFISYYVLTSHIFYKKENTLFQKSWIMFKVTTQHSYASQERGGGGVKPDADQIVNTCPIAHQHSSFVAVLTEVAKLEHFSVASTSHLFYKDARSEHSSYPTATTPVTPLFR